MRPDVTAIFGDPIPAQLLTLAKSVNDAITNAVANVPEVAYLRKESAASRRQVELLKERLSDEIHLHRRNVGGHYYPGCSDTTDVFTSDCKYCDCVMGPSNSRAPEGVDQFGSCPGNPKLRDAYELVKAKKPGLEPASP